MPTKNRHPIVVSLRGDARYGRYLDRLLAAVRRENGARLNSRHNLAEYALTVLGLAHGLKSPPRCGPVGQNQHGVPGAKAPPAAPG